MASYEQAKSLLKNSVARPTLYSLEINGKNILTISDTGTTASTNLTSAESEYIKMFCDSIEFPGLDYEQAVSIGQESMGIQRSVPAGMLFGAGNRLRFSVIENSNFGVYDSLRKLFNSACADGANPIGNRRSQRMNYYNDYKFNIVMRKLEFPNGQRSIPPGDTYAVDYGYKVVATYLFENCYISSIGPVSYNTNERNTYMSFTSSVKFENYHHDNSKYMYDG